ncbi:MAG: zinc metallopeptidase [Planctomycetota bacterium]
MTPNALLTSDILLFGLTGLLAQMSMLGGNMGYLLMVALPSMILSGGAAWLVKSRFAQYSKVPSSRGYTGQMAAQKLLDAAGIHDVQIVRVDGMLTDHYNPRTKQLALSSAVFDRTSIAAIGVATHEAGHAIQHATGYYPLQWRSMIVPAANIGTRFGTWGMMIGLMFAAGGNAMGGPTSTIGFWIFAAGAIAFSLFLLFQLVTLPVEFNASARAKQLVVEAGIVGAHEREGIDKVLNAAAMTYVAAFVTSLLTLLYFLYRAGFFNRRN